MAPRVAFVGIVVACSVAVAAFALWNQRDAGSTATAQSDVDVASGERMNAPGPAPTTDQTQPQRAQRVASVRFGRVVVVGSTPLDAALVTFTRLPLAPDASGVAQTIGGGSETTASGSDGLFRFDLGTRDEESSIAGVIWATAPGFAAGSRLTTTLADWGEGCVLTLERAADLEVAVVREDGQPVAGAVIRQFGLEPTASNARPFRDANGARSAFQREYVGDGLGRARVSRFDGPQRIEAVLGDRRSVPFIGIPGASLRLVLQSSFYAAGRVRSASGPLPSNACVLAESIRSGGRTELERVRVTGDGQWRTAALPACEADEVVFRLEGEGLAPIERSIGRPQAGETYAVDFDTEPGVDAIVQARTADGAPCAGATVYARWYRGGRFFELERRTGADGVARVPVVVGIATYFGARASGLAATPIGPFTYLEPAVRTLFLDLLPAGRIRGRCLRADEPLRDFELMYWQGRPADRQLLRVNDSHDGSFVIEDAPLGEVFVCAHSSTWPMGAIESVQVAAGVDAQVELKVGDSCVGRGQVVDAASGQPVSDASVQAATALPDSSAVMRGSLRTVDSSGSFELSGLPVGRCFVWIVAPGFAARTSAAHAEPGRGADFGVISLARTQTLELRLESDSGFDFTQAFAQTAESPLLPVRYFSAEGRLVYEDVPPKQVQIQVTLGEHLTELVDANLVTGQPWVFVIRIDGGRRCTVRAVSRREAPAPQYLAVSYGNATAGSSRWVKFGSTGLAQVEGIAGEALALTAYAADGTVLGTKTCSIPAEGDVELELVCGGPALRVRVVDGEGKPVPAANVLAGAVSTLLPRPIAYTTDGAGECVLDPFDVEKIRVCASAYSIGLSSAIIVDVAEARDEPVVIKLADLKPLRIRLEDRGFPCAGVAAKFAFDDDYWIDEIQTDTSGRATSQPAGDGRCLVVVDEIGYWPIRHALPYPRTDAETVVPLRRLGGVRFEVRGSLGELVGGAQVSLRSSEFDVDISQWIAEGKLAAPAGGMQTDTSGVLVIDGLPNGPYEWRAVAPNGTQASGMLTVPPRSRAEQSFAFGN